MRNEQTNDQVLQRMSVLSAGRMTNETIAADSVIQMVKYIGRKGGVAWNNKLHWRATSDDWPTSGSPLAVCSRSPRGSFYFS